MSQHTKQLDIWKILQVAESLENIVSRCFGPEGGQVLFIKSTGELLITKNGRRILESLLLDHPVARMIVNSASKHYSITGDGAKSFVLLLCAFIRELWRTFDKNEDLILSQSSEVKQRYKSKCHVLRRISSLLLTFQSRVLEHVTAKCLSPHCQSLYLDTTGKMTLCRTSLQQTLDAYFSGNTACIHLTFISTLACEYLYKCLICADSILEVVSFVDRYFFELLTKVPGFPVDNSRILPGLVLHREFSVYCPAEGELRALIMTDQIHQSLSAPGIAFVISSDVQLQTSQQYLQQRTEHVMKLLQNNQVRLVLSSVKQHEIVNFYAKLYGISIVECLPPEEIDLLCTLTGVCPVSPPFCDLLSNSFLATSCQPVFLGGRKEVQLDFSVSQAFKPHSLVLCGPVKGLTEQIASSVHGAFKMFRWLFQPVGTDSEQPNKPDCLPNTGLSVQKPSATSSVCQTDLDRCDCHLEKTDQMYNTDKPPKALSERTVGKNTLYLSARSQASMDTENTCLNKLEEIPPETVEEEAGVRLGFSVDQCLRTERPVNMMVPKQVLLSPNVGLLLPAGGVFEIVLHHHLHEFAKTCQDAELAMICTMFGDALLCIPRLIYKHKKRKNSFPLVYLEHVDPLKGKKVAGIDQRVLESVTGKCQLMASVLHCISKLVTIDLIVGIKRETRSTESEGEKEDMCPL